MAPKKLPPGQTNDTAGNLTVDRAPRALLECFAPNPRNPRRSAYALQRLADSMTEFGQLQAVVAVSRRAWQERWPEDAAAFPINAQMITLMGSSRLLAAPMAGMAYLDFTLRDDLMRHPLGPIVAAARENLDRQDLSILDEARLCEEVAGDIGEGATAVAIGEKLGKGRHWVNQRRGLLRLCQRIQDAIDSHDPRISIEVARAVSPIGKGLPDEEREALQLKELAGVGINLDEPYVEELEEADDADDPDTAVSDIVNPTKSDTAVSLPRPRVSARRGISPKVAARNLAAYCASMDAETVGLTVRTALDEKKTVEAISAMLDGLGPDHLGSIMQAAADRLRAAETFVG
jgi:ParB-like chromosome segregation protein Spo0J